MDDGATVTSVSVVIPAWGEYAGDNLTEAIASVAEQSVPADVIVVDNASETAVPDLPGSVVIRLDQRRSTGAARNAALGHITTPLVVFLDADDLLLPGSLSALIEGVTGGRDPLTAYTLSILDGRTGRRHRSPRRIARVLSAFPRLFALVNAIWSLLPTQGATIMWVDDVRACGGYGDRNHGEDWVLATSLAFRGRVSFDPRSGLRYRSHANSPGVSALRLSMLIQNAQAVRARIRQDPASPGWALRALPMIAVAQWAAACIAHPVYRSLRALIGGDYRRSGRKAC